MSEAMSETGTWPESGPIDYLVIEFAEGAATGEGMPLLLDLVDRGLIRILDLVFLRKERDGSVAIVELGELDRGHLTAFHGAGSGLLDPEDLEEAAAVLEPATTAAVLVYENVWAAPLAAALRRAGAQLVAGGRVPDDALLATLDAR